MAKRKSKPAQNRKRTGAKQRRGRVPSLHLVRAALEKTEQRVRRFKAPDRHKKKVLNFLADLKKQVGVFCRNRSVRKGDEMIQFIQSLSEE